MWMSAVGQRVEIVVGLGADDAEVGEGAVVHGCGAGGWVQSVQQLVGGK